jgi:hypothetical protein
VCSRFSRGRSSRLPRFGRSASFEVELRHAAQPAACPVPAADTSAEVLFGAYGDVATRHHVAVLNRTARANLLILAVGLTLHEVARDCFSHASLGVSNDLSVVVQRQADGRRRRPSPARAGHWVSPGHSWGRGLGDFRRQLRRRVPARWWLPGRLAPVPPLGSRPRGRGLSLPGRPGPTIRPRSMARVIRSGVCVSWGTSDPSEPTSVLCRRG